MVNLTVKIENGDDSIILFEELKEIIKDIEVSEIKDNDESKISKGSKINCFSVNISNKKTLETIVDRLCAWQKEKNDSRKIELSLKVHDKVYNMEMSKRNPDYESGLRNWINSLSL